ncbi:hypothetical protein D3C72_1959890 [compost metagenome]
MNLANSVAFSSTPVPLKIARLSVMSSVPGPLASGPSGRVAIPQLILVSCRRVAAPDPAWIMPTLPSRKMARISFCS